MVTPQPVPTLDQSSKDKKSKKALLTCGVISAIVVCVGLFLVLGGLGTFVAILGTEPKGLTVEVSSPVTVNPGEDFSININLGNTGNNPLRVTELQLPQSLLDGAVFVNSSPPNSGQVQNDQSTGFKYDLNINPGAKQNIQFTFHAVSGNEYAGDIKVLVGPKRKTTSLKILVSTTVPTEYVQNKANPLANSSGLIPYESVVQIIAMVDVKGQIQQGWTGSGSIISPDGLILTNAHVVLSDPYYEVTELVIALTTHQDEPPEPAYTARVIQADAALDLAVIRITGDAQGNPIDPSALDLPFINIGDSDKLQLGDSLVILGYPGIGGETITLTRGEVSGFTSDRVYGNRGFIKTSATIAGGNSGGMATNSNNELVGVPTQVGYGGEGEVVDCRPLADTNGDSIIDNMDSCIPTGGFINALRPVKLALPLIEGARKGEVNVQQGVEEQAQEVPSGTLISQDGFSRDDGKWFTGGDENGEVYYQNGELLFQISSPNYYYWSEYNIDKDLSNSIFSVDARIIQATGTGDFGLTCRNQDSNNFYALEVSEDGYFSIWKTQDGEETYLYEWEYSNNIPIGQPMVLFGACVDNELALGVNDKILVDITDDSFQRGSIGLLTGTFDTPNIIVGFDNFSVYQP